MSSQRKFEQFGEMQCSVHKIFSDSTDVIATKMVVMLWHPVGSKSCGRESFKNTQPPKILPS